MLAIVLAAGRGTRLGQGKALIDLCGESALQRCLRGLEEGGVDELRVVLGHDAAHVRVALQAAALELPVDIVVNPEPERGQTSSVQLGLRAGAGNGPAFVLHTVDHPLLTSDDVRALRTAWATRPPGCAIAVPSVDGRRGHPALYDVALADEFLALAGDQPAHTVLRRDPSRVLHVPRANLWLVRDIDTLEDLAAARAALSGAS